MNKHGIAVLTALLLCGLMIGVVSAEGTWVTVTTADDLRSNLTAGNQTRLGEDITDSSTGSLVIEKGIAPVLDLAGNTLTFPSITTSVAIAIGNDTEAKNASLVIQDSVGEGKIAVSNGYLFLVRNSSALTLDAGTFEAKYFVVSGNAAGMWSYPVVTINSGVTINSTEDTAMYFPAEGGVVTIEGATIEGVLGGICVASGDVTITDTTITVAGQSEPRWNNKDGSADDGSAVVVQKKSASYTGDLNLKLLGNTVVNGPNADALHNYIRKAPADPDTATITIADAVVFNGNLRSYQYDSADAVIGGIFQDEEDNLLLYPGLNMTGVTWAGSDVDGWELELSESGSYILKDTFNVTGKGIQITADGVTLDGADLQITDTGCTNGYILKVSASADTEGTELLNLNLTTESTGYSTGNYGFVDLGTKTILRNSTLDFSPYVSTSTTMVPGIYVHNHDGTEISGNVLTAANIKSSIATDSGSSSSRGIVLSGGSNHVVSENVITLGSTAESTNALDSIGIQVKGNAKNVSILDNVLMATAENPNMGISITASATIEDEDGYTIQDNMFAASDGCTFTSVVQLFASGYMTGNLNLSLDMQDNIIANATHGISLLYGATRPNGEFNYTLVGTIANNDFSGIADLAEFINDTISGDANPITFVNEAAWNITPTEGKNIVGDDWIAGNWWGDRSKNNKSSLGYKTYADAEAALAAGLPVADLTPLVTQTELANIKINGPTNVTPNVKVIFNATVDGSADTYVWKVNGKTVTGFTEDSIEYTFNGTETIQTVPVEVTASKGSVSVTDSISVTVDRVKAVPTEETGKVVKPESGSDLVPTIIFSTEDAGTTITVAVQDDTTAKGDTYKVQIPNIVNVLKVLNVTVTNAAASDVHNLDEMAVLKFSVKLDVPLEETQIIQAFRFVSDETTQIAAMPLKTEFIRNTSAGVPDYTYDCTVYTPGFSDIVPAVVTGATPVPPQPVPVNDNGGADDGLALLAAAKATPTPVATTGTPVGTSTPAPVEPTAVPTTEVTVQPTTTATAEASGTTAGPTAAAAPAPLLGLLAGLGIAAVFGLRRK